MSNTFRPMRRPPGAVQLGLRVLLVAPYIFVVAGCATAGSSSSSRNDLLIIEARLLNTDGDSVRSEWRNTDPTLALGAIPGDIRGSPNRTLQFVHLIETAVVAINTEEFSAEMQREMSRETDDLLISGLSVEPSDTRFARISVVLMRKGSPVAGMAVGFIDADSHEPMTLFYFDRPCRVSGTLPGDPGMPSPVTYDVEVKKAGLTWLAAIPQESGGAIELVARESTSKMVVAAPVNNLKNGRFQLK
jgi:hypothetical protein